MTKNKKSPPSGLKTLVLGNDYVPLNVVHWKKAIKRLFESPCERCGTTGRVIVEGRIQMCNHCQGTGLLPPAIPVEYFDAGYLVLDGRLNEHLIPAVIANAHHVYRKYRRVPFSKPNVLRRDGYRCQFCGGVFPPGELTQDHVVPRSMWNGNTTATCWTNIVAACRKCNLKKANRTPEGAGMPLRKYIKGRFITYRKPKAPSSQEISLGLTYRTVPEEWERHVAPFRKSLPSS